MIYIIDYENVTQCGFDGHHTLSPEDEVIVFLSPEYKKIDTNILTNSRAAFRFIGITPNGHKNYMDFQIVALAAKLASEKKNVAIVSNDKGYTAVQDFFRNCVLLSDNIDIKLVSNLKGDPVREPVKKTVKTKQETTNETDKVPEPVKTKTIKPETVDSVVKRLPIDDHKKEMLMKVIDKANKRDKKVRLTKKKFIKKLDFIGNDARQACIDAVIGYVNLA